MRIGLDSRGLTANISPWLGLVQLSGNYRVKNDLTAEGRYSNNYRFQGKCELSWWEMDVNRVTQQDLFSRKPETIVNCRQRSFFFFFFFFQMETISDSPGTESSEPELQMPQQPPGMRQPRTFQTYPMRRCPHRSRRLSETNKMLTCKAN